MSKTKQLVETATEDQLAILDASYPVDDSPRAIRLPRLGFLSKDIEEESGVGKNKIKKVVQAAGTFFTELETDEVEELADGKTRKVWQKEYLDKDSIDGVIFFHRKQLRMFDSADNMYINTPIYDESNELVPLYKGSTKIDEGTPAELQSKYPALTAKGKPTSKLKEEKILYILFEGQVYQMNLTQSSKFEFQDYGRRTHPGKVVTTLSASEEQVQGSNKYKKILFTEKGPISKADADFIVPKIQEMNEAIQAKKARYSADSEMKQLASEASKVGKGF